MIFLVILYMLNGEKKSGGLKSGDEVSSSAADYIFVPAHL